MKSYFQQRWLDLLSGYLTNNPAAVKTEDVDDGEVAAADLTGFSPPLQDQARRLTCLLCKKPTEESFLTVRDVIREMVRHAHELRKSVSPPSEGNTKRNLPVSCLSCCLNLS